MVLTS